VAATYENLVLPNLHELELAEWSVGDDPKAHGRIAVATSAAEGATSTVVYLEVDPGDNIPLHTHSAEETIVVLGGAGTVTAGDRQAEARVGDVIVAPAFVRHGWRNDGEETLKFIGVFGTGAVTTTFDEPVAPFGVATFAIPLAG
jgi:quercetin dioxygenase-like cupin family protein